MICRMDILKYVDMQPYIARTEISWKCIAIMERPIIIQHYNAPLIQEYTCTKPRTIRVELHDTALTYTYKILLHMYNVQWQSQTIQS